MGLSSRAFVLLVTVAAGCSGGGGSPIDSGGDGPAVIDGGGDASLVDGAGLDGDNADALPTIACGTGTPIFDLPSDGMASGSSLSSTPGNIASATCLGRGAETVYLVTIDHAVTMVASTVSASTTLDTVLYLRTDCADVATELGCNDNADDTHTSSALTVDLTPGTYYLVVDGRNVGAAGDYQLSVVFYEGVGEPCTTPAMCGPGYTCRAIPPATQTTCERHVCGDGRDDDGDGRIDYPADPGCTSVLDDSELDSCPGPGCPVCANGLDDDTDGLTDYPMDPGCLSASSDSEENCVLESDPVSAITAGTTTGTTAGATADFGPSCVQATNADRIYLLHVRQPLTSLSIDTSGSAIDTVLALYNSLCATQLACDDDSGDANGSALTIPNLAAGTYAIDVDTFGGGPPGNFVLHVRGTYFCSQYPTPCRAR